jgi:nucleotide-binding universal stress UspA family protein
MSEQPTSEPPPAVPAGGAEPERADRVFLVVVDETPEMQKALHFASARAQHTGGRVAMLYVIEPPEFQHWLGVERVMQEEARQLAEETLQALAAKVQAMTGRMPILHIREGRRRDELLALLEEELDISILVLGTASGHSDPGPLVTYLVGSMGEKVRVPITLVPGHLSEEEIDNLS